MSSYERVETSEDVSRRSIFRSTAVIAGGVLIGGAADLADPREALAAGEPHVYTRGDWGAISPKRAATVLDRGPDHIVVHHTATSNVSDYSKSQAAALSRAIQRYHMYQNGWDDTGQQLTISRGGWIMEGRNRSLSAIRAKNHVRGAHTANHNSHTIGIENEGRYTAARPTYALMESLVETCAWLCATYGLNPSSAIVGHRDYNATGCPGDELYAMLPQLRRDVGAELSRLEARVEMDQADIPSGHLPGYPAVPQTERAVEFYHGPGLGEQEETGLSAERPR